MDYNEAIKKIDFLNNRMRKIEQWYKWSIKIDWDKINKWCKFFGYVKVGDK